MTSQRSIIKHITVIVNRMAPPFVCLRLLWCPICVPNFIQIGTLELCGCYGNITKTLIDDISKWRFHQWVPFTWHNFSIFQYFGLKFEHSVELYVLSMKMYLTPNRLVMTCASNRGPTTQICFKGLFSSKSLVTLFSLINFP